MTRLGLALLFSVLVAPIAAGARPDAPRQLSREVLEDKVRGGWAGQMIGVAYGAPTEFGSNGRIIVGNLGHYLDWSPERLRNVIQQDDLYVEMTFAQVMDTLGLEATTEQYGEMFRDSQYLLWHANAAARRNLNRGIKAPLSGHPRYNAHANDIDFQIESDFIGLMTPGLPREANKYADRVGRVMNWGDGLYGGMFVAGMYSAAFFESDTRKVVERGLRSIPQDSAYARLIADVLRWSAEYPADWTKTWQLVEDKWNRNDSCPDGATQALNIDAKLNGGYIALGLLYGQGDFDKTLEVATRAGQDSDCNPSSAAGVLGVMLGYRQIPEQWRAGIPALADTRFSYTPYSFNDIVASTLRRAVQVVEQAGGQVTPTMLEIPAQEPQAPPLEQWEMGVVRQVVRVSDPAWTFNDGFTVQSEPHGALAEILFRQATTSGATAELRFDGTGVAVLGIYSGEGGRADVLLDGRRAEYPIDAWLPANTFDVDYWHVSGLADGRHTLKIVARADADARSKGTKVQIVRAVVFGGGAPATGN